MVLPSTLKTRIAALLKLIRVYQRAHLLLLRSKKGGHYAFSYEDMKLFVHQHFWRLPETTEVTRIGGLVQLQIDDARIFWPAAFERSELPWLYNEVFLDRAENASSYDHEKAAIPVDGWVIDAGAHEGFFCQYAFSRGAGIVIAVEPIRGLRDALNKSFEGERGEGRFSVETAGLGREPGEMNLTLDPEHPCEARIDHRSGGNTVKIVTIDEITSRHDLCGPGLIKMDIEGAEMDALMGARNALETQKPSLAIAVYHERENALKCASIIQAIRSDYQIEFRGLYGYSDDGPRPYLLFAW